MDESESMQEAFSRELDMQDEWLGETRYCILIIDGICESLAILAGKRATLEEKVIRRNLHEVVEVYGQIIQRIHSKLAQKESPSSQSLEHLRSVNLSVHDVIADFLKVLRFNLNFLEQYYEYDFVTRLTQEHQFPYQLREVLRLL